MFSALCCQALLSLLPLLLLSLPLCLKQAGEVLSLSPQLLSLFLCLFQLSFQRAELLQQPLEVFADAGEVPALL